MTDTDQVPAEDTALVRVDRSHDITASGQTLPTLAELERAEAVANRIAHSSMVPKDLRGDPGAVLAVVLSGRELGIGAMQALRDIDFIEGKPSASAKLQRELLRKAGHEVELLTASNDRTRARYRFRRREWPADRWVEWEFTIDDAVDAGLCTLVDGKVSARSTGGKAKPWEQYTAAMLRHRALSSLTTEWCPEVLGAAQYTAEELGATVDAEGRAIHVESIDRSERSTTEQSWLDLLERAEAFSPATARYIRDTFSEGNAGIGFSAATAETQRKWLDFGERSLATAQERRGDTPSTPDPVEHVDGEVVTDDAPTPADEEHADADDAEVVPDEPPAWHQSERQSNKLHATLKDAHVDDPLRHQLVRVVTDGRVSSSKDLTKPEYDRLLWLAERLKADKATVDYDPDGSLLLAMADGTALDADTIRQLSGVAGRG